MDKKITINRTEEGHKRNKKMTKTGQANKQKLDKKMTIIRKEDNHKLNNEFTTN